MILTVDIGGTYTRLQIFRSTDSAVQQYDNADFHSIQNILQVFLKKYNYEFSATIIAVAGPRVEDTIHITNLGWEIDADDMPTALGNVYLLNDLEAAAYGYQGEDEVVLYAGNKNAEKILLIGIGTGVGGALRLLKKNALIVLTTELGHMLRNHKSTYEEYLGGTGFANTYNNITNERKTPQEILANEHTQLLNEYTVIFHDFLCTCIVAYLPNKIVLTGGFAQKIIPRLQLDLDSLTRSIKPNISIPTIVLASSTNLNLQGCYNYYAEQIKF